MASVSPDEFMTPAAGAAPPSGGMSVDEFMGSPQKPPSDGTTFLDQARDEGLKSAIESVPGRLKNWLASLPKADTGGPSQLEAIYKQKTGQDLDTSTMGGVKDFVNFTANDPEASALVRSNPFMTGFMPGEGLMRSPISLESGAAPTPAMVARQSGYVVPPTMAGEGGIASNALSGVGGKIKLQQAASAKNQTVTNELGAKALGLPPDAPLTENNFEKVRADAGKPFEALKTVNAPIKPDNDYLNDVVGLSGDTAEAAKTFGGIVKNDAIEKLQDDLIAPQTFTTRQAIETVKQLRFDAAGNLKNLADPGKRALGFAQRRAADALDDLMERNLTAAGHTDLVAKYREARQLIAKSYDLESATNTDTGNVNAQKLGSLSSRGRPLTGELQTIATTANTFPKAMQPLERVGGEEPHSILDIGASAYAAAHGHPEIAALMYGRPLARRVLLSPLFQHGAVPTFSPSIGSGNPVVSAAMRGALLHNLLSPPGTPEADLLAP